jgi:hypothetical protein
MVTTMGFLQYYLKSSTKRGWEMSCLLVAIQSMFTDLPDENRALIIVLKKYGKAAESYYTYSFQDPSEVNFLFKAKTGHLMIGLIDKDVTFSVPISLFNASDIEDQEMRIDDLENVYTMKFAKQEIRINEFIL